MNVTMKYFFLACLLTWPIIGHAKEWRGIVPLHSTRADVERSLGPASKDSNNVVTRHETKDEEVRVQYSTGEPCGTGWPGIWRIPAGTVVTISVYPKEEVRFTELLLDESRYKKTDNEGHGPPYVYYTNEEEGIQYEVTQGLVMAIRYLPASRDNHLRCPTGNAGPIPTSFNARGWRDIVPLQSTRPEVERLLGQPRLLGGVNTYDFTNETVDIFYLKRSCRIDSQGWNVPVNTVTSVRIEPKKKVRLSETQWDLSKFRKEPGSFDNPSYFLFINEEDGLTLSAFGDVLEAYSYGPRRSDRGKRCPNYSVAEEQRLRNCDPITFLVECSSEEITVGQPVSCHAWFGAAPLNFSPTIQWSVSNDASFVPDGKGIKVSARNSKARTILVVGEVKSPNICMRSSSIALRVRAKDRATKP